MNTVYFHGYYLPRGSELYSGSTQLTAQINYSATSIKKKTDQNVDNNVGRFFLVNIQNT